MQVVQCPNCKAPMHGPVCEYCGTVVERPSQAPGVAVNINIGGGSRPMNAAAGMPGVSVHVNGQNAYGPNGYGPNGQYGAGPVPAGYTSQAQYNEYAGSGAGVYGTESYGYGSAPAYAAGYAAGRAAAQGYGSGYGTYVHVSDRSWIIALLLCFFVGYLGAHYFYVGKWGWGLVFLFTAGFFGVGWFVDIIRILIGSFRDKNGLPLNKNA